MTQYSPKLIEKTISILECQTGSAISEEDARQAIENISGFFRVLQDWAEAENRELCDEASTDMGMAERSAR
jgi:hypothetical protein